MLTLFGTVPGPYSDARLKEKLAALPKPRVVAISWGNQASFLFLFLFLCVWAAGWTRAIVESWKTQMGWAILAAFFGISFGWIWFRELRREIRSRSLLMNGELALGQISSQQTTGTRNKRSEITYEFADASGRRGHGKGFDQTKKYAVNMPIIIFYEGHDLSQNVAICATVWKLRAPDGKLVDTD
jgi:hypothetical protein